MIKDPVCQCHTDGDPPRYQKHLGYIHQAVITINAEAFYGLKNEVSKKRNFSYQNYPFKVQ